MASIREHKEAAKVGLDEALATITEAIRQHWSTGGGRRLRQIVWSIWNGHTVVSLWDVMGGLDLQLGRAIAKLSEAKLMEALDSDDLLRRVLQESGEFARFDLASRDTLEGEEILYLPIHVSAEGLRRLANSVAKQEARLEAERRAEADRFACLEVGVEA